MRATYACIHAVCMLFVRFDSLLKYLLSTVCLMALHCCHTAKSQVQVRVTADTSAQVGLLLCAQPPQQQQQQQQQKQKQQKSKLQSRR
jgi:hypothetical protein